MQYLTQANKDMTELLQEKVESMNGSLPRCEGEELDAITKIKYCKTLILEYHLVSSKWYSRI